MQSDNADADSPPQPQRHYASRTCRICLEVVPPTFEPVPEGLSGILHPSPRVVYISQEPESGRLIRPCKCKGSQRYVHEGCLQQWRFSSPSRGRRNIFECPTCRFQYRLERMRWGKWITSPVTQVILTMMILFITVFILGFVADPIINFYLYMDPLAMTNHLSKAEPTDPLSPAEPTIPDLEDGNTTWVEHIMKGMASLGLLGIIKVLLASPWQWLQIRNTGLLRARPRNARFANGRDRLQSISWYVVAVGVFTFLWAVWKAVRAWSRRTLEKAGEKVMDVQGEDEIEEEPAPEPRERQ